MASLPEEVHLNKLLVRLPLLWSQLRKLLQQNLQSPRWLTCPPMEHRRASCREEEGEVVVPREVHSLLVAEEEADLDLMLIVEEAEVAEDSELGVGASLPQFHHKFI